MEDGYEGRAPAAVGRNIVVGLAIASFQRSVCLLRPTEAPVNAAFGRRSERRPSGWNKRKEGVRISVERYEEATRSDVGSQGGVNSPSTHQTHRKRTGILTNIVRR